MEIKVLSLKKIKNFVKSVIDLGGTRTHSLWLRRPTPYPLGHKVHQNQGAKIAFECICNL